jgi:hypothetical protein
MTGARPCIAAILVATGLTIVYHAQIWPFLTVGTLAAVVILLRNFEPARKAYQRLLEDFEQV